MKIPCIGLSKPENNYYGNYKEKNFFFQSQRNNFITLFIFKYHCGIGNTSLWVSDSKTSIAFRTGLNNVLYQYFPPILTSDKAVDISVGETEISPTLLSDFS